MKKEDIKDKINNVSKSIRADIISTKYGDRKVYRDEMGRFTSGNSYKSNKENGSNFGARPSKIEQLVGTRWSIINNCFTRIRPLLKEKNKNGKN